jgi:hypothetical protein
MNTAARKKEKRNQSFEDRKKEAIECFGSEVVDLVESLVAVSDADDVWSLMAGQGMDEHQECVEMLYFELE